MSGGGGGGTQTVNQNTIPTWLKGPVLENVGRAKALTEQEYQPYTGERVAQFTPLQKMSYQGAANQQTAGQLGMGTGLAGIAGVNALNIGNQTFDQNAANQYMSPYMQSVVQMQQRDADRQAQIAGTQRNAAATKAGAFGGSRQAIEDAEAARNLALQKGDIQAQGLQSAFGQAQNQFNADQNRSLSAQGAAVQAAGALGGLGEQQYNQQMGITQLRNQLGGQQQQQVQGILDQQYGDFQRQQQYPYQQVGFMSDVLRGTAPLTQAATTVYQAPASPLSQIAGLGTAMYGLSKASGGTLHYADGGITGLLSDQQLDQRAQAPDISMIAKLAVQKEQMDREQMRTGAQGIQAAQTPPPQTTVAQEQMQQLGLAGLPVPDDLVGSEGMADGGIVSFANTGAIDPELRRQLEESSGNPYINDIRRTLGGLADYARNTTDPFNVRTSRAVADQTNEFFNVIPGYVRDAAQKTALSGAYLADPVMQQVDALAHTPTNIEVPRPGEVADLVAAQRARLGMPARPDIQGPPVSLAQGIATPTPGAPAAPAAAPNPADPSGANAGIAAGARTSATIPAGGIGDLDIAGIMKRLNAKRDAQGAELIKQQQGVNAQREADAATSAAELEQEIAARGEFGTEREKRLREQESKLTGKEADNTKMAIIEAGLAMMSGTSPFALVNIGKGGTAGIESYKAGAAKIEEARDKLDEAFSRLDEARRAEKIATGKERRDARTAVRAAKTDGMQALMAANKAFGYDATAADTKTQFDAMVDVWKTKANTQAQMAVAATYSNAKTGKYANLTAAQSKVQLAALNKMADSLDRNIKSLRGSFKPEDQRELASLKLQRDGVLSDIAELSAMHPEEYTPEAKAARASKVPLSPNTVKLERMPD